jgi:copper chaperone
MEEDKMTKKIFVEGMKCENCARHVKEALNNITGVIRSDVNLADHYVILEADTEVRDEAIKLSVNTEKYKVVRIETL